MVRSQLLGYDESAMGGARSRRIDTSRENVLVMVRLATVLAKEARTAGRATLVPIEAKAREATMRAEAIVMDVDV